MPINISRRGFIKRTSALAGGLTLGWELSAVPYIPALENVARHAENLPGAGVDDLDAWRAVYPPEIFIQQLEKVLNCRDLLAHWLPRLRASRLRESNGSRI